jgi:hypothetical protein
MAVVSDNWGWSDVVARWPAMSANALEVQEAIKAEVRTEIINERWGDRANQAATHLAAHKGALSLRTSNGPVGAMTNATVDKVTRGFNGPGNPDAYDATPAGREYKRLRDQIFRFPFVPTPPGMWP